MRILKSNLRKIIRESIREMALVTHRELDKNIDVEDIEDRENLSSFIQKNLKKNETKLARWFQTNRTFGDADVHVLPFAGSFDHLYNILSEEGIDLSVNERNASCDITHDLLTSLGLNENEVNLNKNNVIMIPCVAVSSDSGSEVIGEYYTPWRMLHSIFDCDINDLDYEDVQESIPGGLSVSYDDFVFSYEFFIDLPYEDILNCSNHGSFKISRAKYKSRKENRDTSSAETADFVDNPTEAFFELLVSAFIRKEKGPDFIKTSNMQEEDYITVYNTLKSIANGAREELINKCILVNITN